VRRPQPENSTGGVVRFLLAAYRCGLFPMADPESGIIHWCSPRMRGVLPLTHDEGLRVPRSLRRRINSRYFTIRCDTCFERVVRACAVRPPEEGSWIDERIVRWYTRLHDAGHAHCLEAWCTNETGEEHLVGGVYGVCIGAAFFGESMFSRPRPRLPSGQRHPLDGTDASKVCLVALIEHLRACGYTLFDTQMHNEHIAQFGVHEITRDEYLERLEHATNRDDAWRDIARAGG